MDLKKINVSDLSECGSKVFFLRDYKPRCLKIFFGNCLLERGIKKKLKMPRCLKKKIYIFVNGLSKRRFFKIKKWRDSFFYKIPSLDLNKKIVNGLSERGLKKIWRYSKPRRLKKYL